MTQFNPNKKSDSIFQNSNLDFEEFPQTETSAWLNTFIKEMNLGQFSAKQVDAQKQAARLDPERIIDSFPLFLQNLVHTKPIYPLEQKDYQNHDFTSKAFENAPWKSIACHDIPIITADSQQVQDILDILKQRNIARISLNMNFSQSPEKIIHLQRLLEKILISENFYANDQKTNTPHAWPDQTHIKTIDIENIHFPITHTPEWQDFISFLEQKNNESPLDFKDHINLFFDPLHFSCSEPSSPEENLEQWFKETQNQPNESFAYQLQITGHEFQNNGASIVQELSFVLSKAQEYLHFFTNSQAKQSIAFPKWRFSIPISSHFFYEIAKLKTLRFLWLNVISQYSELQNGNGHLFQPIIFTKNAVWNKTLYDPYTNILRSGLETAASIWGTANGHCSLPYNILYDPMDCFAHRIAVNYSMLLEHESYAQNTFDPFRGSFYVEDIIQKLSQKAWDLFQNIEEQGGYFQCFKSGHIKELINESRQEKIKQFHHSHSFLIGSNAYPQKNETIFDVIKQSSSGSIDQIEQEIKNSVNYFFSIEQKKHDANGINSFRISQHLEYLRIRADRFFKEKKDISIPIYLLQTKAQTLYYENFITNFLLMSGLPSQSIELIHPDDDAKNTKDKIQTMLNFGHPIIALAGSPEVIVLNLQEWQKNHNDQLKKTAFIVPASQKQITDYADHHFKEEFTFIYLSPESHIILTLKQIHKSIGIIS